MSDLDKLIAAVEAGDEAALYGALRAIASAARDKGEYWPAHDATKAFDGDLNAALRLHEALLPGWDYRLGRDGDDFHALVFVCGRLQKHSDDWQMCPESTARAWLLAILCALKAGAAK